LRYFVPAISNAVIIRYNDIIPRDFKGSTEVFAYHQ
jgi:hypothetical protein